MKIILVRNGMRLELKEQNMNDVLAEAQNKAKQQDACFDAIDEQGRVVAVVSPKKIDVMNWAKHLA